MQFFAVGLLHESVGIDLPVELQQDDERVLAGEEDVHVRNHSKSARQCKMVHWKSVIKSLTS